jgi:putative membrane protein insertion efficiency factor
MKMIKKVMSFIIILIFKFYRYVISPHTMRACRYEPSCSVYAIEAVQTHGPFKGSWLGIKRILSCHPKGGFGYDPVPSVEEIKKSKKNYTH